MKLYKYNFVEDIRKYDEDTYFVIGNDKNFHKVRIDQETSVEAHRTEYFLNYIKSKGSQFISVNTDINLINYGDNELIYILDNGKGINKYVLLVAQPIFSNLIKEEYVNLIKLSKLCKNIVIPLEYIDCKDRKAFITPYISNARSISVMNDFGSYIPELGNKFFEFSEDGRYVVNKVIIANLVKLYNEKEQKGLANVRIADGDFILDKKTDMIELTEKNILENMYLVSARKLINLDFKSYLRLIRKEFSKLVYFSEKNIINDKSRVNMTQDEIEDGIKLGLYLRK